jgi:hypothetical protein
LNKDIYQILSAPMPSLPIQFYMDSGTVGLDAGFLPEDQRLASFLQEKGMTEQNLVFRIFPYADHTETDWARRLYVPTQWLLAGMRSM